MMRLTRMRTARGWSQSELARQAGLHQAQVCQIENGRMIPPDQSTTLQKLAAALEWNGQPKDLLGRATHGAD